ncbi:MAG: DMT family transporter [Flavobacteriales bacterium]|nr:DMT family transporter [Flavobacteriales bacterium]
MRPSGRGPDRLSWLLLGTLALIWGSSFILMKRGLWADGRPVLSPGQVASARLAIAWAVLVPATLRHWSMLRPHWRPLLLAGVLGNGIPALLFATAQTRIDSALSGMLNSLTPLFTLVIGLLLFSAQARMAQLTGVLLGLVGAVGLVVFDPGSGPAGWSLYALLPVAGTMCYGASANVVKHRLYMLPSMATAALALTFVGPVGLAGCIATGLPGTLEADPAAWPALGFVALLALLSSAFSLVLWNALLKRTSAVQASAVTYLMPVVAIGWGLLDGERLGLMQVVMIAVVLGGVYLVTASDRA